MNASIKQVDALALKRKYAQIEVLLELWMEQLSVMVHEN